MNSKVANIIRSVPTSIALLFQNLAGEKNHCDTTKEPIFLFSLLASILIWMLAGSILLDSISFISQLSPFPAVCPSTLFLGQGRW